MDDLEKIRRLTYANAAIVLCSPGTARASEVHAALAEAGCPPALSHYIHDYGNAQAAVAFILKWAKKVELL